jgi:dTDP-glucose 4,6-dehydratase
MNIQQFASTHSQYHPGVEPNDLALILSETPTRVWDSLRGKHIFITGGTGFVGCWLVEALLWANQQLDLQLRISLLSRNPVAFMDKAPHLATHAVIELIQGDVTDLKNINGIFDIIIHAATDVANNNSNPVSTLENIIAGTKETLELAKRSYTKHYLLTSSGAIYGRQPEAMTHIDEHYHGAPDLLDSNTAYGQGKRISEWLANSVDNAHIHISIARCFALIGPYLPLDAQFAAGNFIRDGLDNKTISVRGDGTSCRSYLYAADMVIWLLRIMIDGNPRQCYNLGSEESITIKALAEKISHFIFGENRVSIALQPKPDAIIQRYVPSVRKAQQQLGLAQYTNLDEAIIKTIAWEKRRRTSTINIHQEPLA